ncbi:MAG: FkbM family methyltransferase [Candidatus Marsarchaeota archaeon]|nr:FkbM family methyltransferase [Candidatus Marsarchaeota archaeon]MCL5412987.1 FkbM family methyltransferase [Candidatus Marsarchaeota archaeon]
MGGIFKKRFGHEPSGDLPVISGENLPQCKEKHPQISSKGRMKEVFLLVGPIAVGKSHVGNLIERNFGITFFDYEEIFVKEQRINPKGYLERAEQIAEHAILDFLEENGRICFENTMSRPYSTKILEKLRQIADVRIIYVNASLDLTLKRLERRDGSIHVRWTPEEVRDIYNTSKNIELDYDLVLQNATLSDEELLRQIQAIMDERKWEQDHVEIRFRGQELKFSSWSGSNLTAYDMEYKPWRTAFRKENVDYLRHYDLKQGDVVIDAGGYKGTFAVYAAKAVGESGRVIVFEPDSENYKMLQKNIELNGLINVTLIHKALWGETDRLLFNDKHTAGSSFFGGSFNTREIDAVSLDEELKKLAVTRVDFIKMDIEGSEIQALNGAKRTLTENDANMAIASYHIIDGKRTSTKVEEILRDLGYIASTEVPQHPITYGVKKRK